MPALPTRRTRFVLAAASATVLLAGCGSMQEVGRSVASVITPYKVEVVQGNFISKEQVQALQPGMVRDQVRQILGTPLVTSLFHGDRWDYVFTIRRKGVEAQRRQLTVWFKDDRMERVEGDPMPSEAEFVSTLDTRRKPGKVPRLEATEEELRAFPKSAPPTPAPAAAAPAPSTANYPPLEPASR
jgi:outer membrane protein assembly factor BamE